LGLVGLVDDERIEAAEVTAGEGMAEFGKCADDQPFSVDVVSRLAMGMEALVLDREHCPPPLGARPSGSGDSRVR